MSTTHLNNGVFNNYTVESQVLSHQVTRSNFPLHSELLHQVQIFQSQLKQEKLRDQVVYQFLKDQLSTCSSPLKSPS